MILPVEFVRIAALVLLGLDAPQRQQPVRAALTQGTIAITGATVIPMTNESVMRDATVLVRDGRIQAVGPRASVTVPDGVRTIDGRGKFIIPGLADMHTHLHSDGPEVHDSAGPAELGVMVAAGVTTARLMIGTPEQLVLRRAVAEGKVVGPQLWLAGPHLVGRQMENGIVVTNEVEARAAVRLVKEQGYDFVKITLFITRPVYDAIIDEARLQNIPVAGHIDPQVGVARALETGQQVEHLDSYLEAALSDSAPSKTSVTQQFVFNPRNWVSLDYIDDRKVAAIAGATARSGAFVGPTQNIFNTAFATGESDSVVRARPDWELWPVAKRDGYLRARDQYWAPATAEQRTAARRRRYVEVRNAFVKQIQDSGGKILAGSDTPEWFHSYGWGLHRELEALVKAGLTPHQALAAATRTPAEYFRATSDWGTIAPGRRADLVMLSANPLDDIKNTMAIDAVMLGGRWLDRTERERMFERARRAINPK
jgi:imidazolonepropionase-like amidohydrolase